MNGISAHVWLKATTIVVSKQETVMPEQSEAIFRDVLDQLRQGYHIGPGTLNKLTKNRPMLCKDDEHPHNGSTIRVDEKELDDPNLVSVYAACYLYEMLFG